VHTPVQADSLLILRKAFDRATSISALALGRSLISIVESTPAEVRLVSQRLNSAVRSRIDFRGTLVRIPP